MTRVEFSRYLVCKNQQHEDCDLDQSPVVNLITTIGCYKINRADLQVGTKLKHLLKFI